MKCTHVARPGECRSFRNKKRFDPNLTNIEPKLHLETARASSYNQVIHCEPLISGISEYFAQSETVCVRFLEMDS